MVITDNRSQLDATHLRATLRPEGELDAGTVEDFASSVQDALRSGAHEVDVDLAEVGFMDTSVLRILENARESLEMVGGYLCLRNANDQVRKLLSLTAFAAGGPA